MKTLSFPPANTFLLYDPSNTSINKGGGGDNYINNDKL